MFAFLPRLFAKFFPEVSNFAARQQQTRRAEYLARRSQARRVRPRLEELEGRIVLDAYVFSVAGTPSQGAWTDAPLWTDSSDAGKNGTLPGAGDTVTIPAGATCTLDSNDAQTIAGLTVSGSLTTKSMLTV